MVETRKKSMENTTSKKKNCSYKKLINNKYNMYKNNSTNTSQPSQIKKQIKNMNLYGTNEYFN